MVPSLPVLPIDAVLPALGAALDRHATVILEAPTGAGKTTRVPPALLAMPWAAAKRIVMLEPRRLAARAAAGRMAAEYRQEVGETAGYRIRFDSRVGSATRIEVVTDGLFTRMITDDPALEGVAAVVFDEFHERSLEVDTALALCLDAQAVLRPDLRLVVMSATLDGARLSSFLGGAPVIRSEGRLFPVAVHHAAPRDAEVPLDRLVARGIARALEAQPGDVLVFLPGRGEIERVARLVDQPGGAGPVVHRLHGELDQAVQDGALRPAPAGQRKVILATNIAETSLTIDGVGAVVDSGLARFNVYDPGSAMSRLVTERISLASAEQRRGRAGRLGPGLCFRLWTAAEERAMAPATAPEIARADLAPFALDLALWGVADPATLRLPDQPNGGRFAAARLLLDELGALDRAGRLTAHGRALAALGTHPRLAQLMIEGRDRGEGAMAARLAAVVEGRDILRLPPGMRDCDLLRRLDALAGRRQGESGALRAARQTAAQWRRRLGVARDAPDRPDAAAELVALAFPDRVARRRPGGEPRFLTVGGQGVSLDPADPLAAAGWLAIARLDGAPREARIQLAAQLDDHAAETLFAGRIETTATVAFDGDIVRARRRRSLGAIVLADEPWPDAPPDMVAAALVDALGSRGVERLPWTAAAAALRHRVAFARRIEGADWPDWSDTALAASLGDWLGPALSGMTRLSDVARIDLGQVLQQQLDPAARHRLDRLAPASITVPSGRDAILDYSQEAGPVLAVKLQEMFGTAATPRVAGGRVPVIVHLLSPAGRPVQVTRDLASFWAIGYKAVRADLRGRYPKHPWPDDPTTAPATAYTRRRAESGRP